MWHETLYQILNTINTVILTLIGIPFFVQLLYMLFFWVKKTTFPKSDKKGKVAFLIPAHNEEDVIFDTVKSIFTKQDYPKELIDVYVVAHNCNDKTAELAEKAGAKVIILDDPDPSRHILAYALNYGFDYLLKNDKDYDFYLRIDADNHLSSNFTTLMNDCFQSGVEFARPYESSLNMTQNRFTKACGLYYIFDSRFASRVRERLGIAAHVNGPGTMVSKKMMQEIGGYGCKTISDDAEFNFNRMLEKRYGHFVEDAVVYEDLPSTFSDTLKRNIRIGSGSVRLIFSTLGKLFLKFFTTFRISYLEMFLTYIFNLICVVLCTWIPLFYIYDVIYLALCGNGTIAVSTFEPSYYSNLLTQTLIIAGFAIGILFIFCGLLQGFLLILLDYKKMGATKRRQLVDGALLFPVFTIIYCLTICIGVFSKPKWGKVNRNKKASIDVNNLE